MPLKYEDTITFETVTCCSCGVTFAMPERFVKKLRENGNTFYCPSGHTQYFGDSEVKRLKKELEKVERAKKLYEGYYKSEQSDHEHTRRRLSATKGVLTKTKKRVAAGTCPCCDKHFAHLARHMAGQHPEYVQEGEEE